MGIYVNPGNSGFSRINNQNYVDKTGLIARLNRRIGGSESLVCVSRPRRFGKTYAAKMLTAYYDCSCDSHDLFDHKRVARTKDYATHLNQYNVIYLDISGFTSTAQREGIPLKEVPGQIVRAIHREIEAMNPAITPDISMEDALVSCVEQKDGKPFIFIIDEWDAMIREARHDREAQTRYLSLLRSWFKNDNFTPRVVAAAYMTGILPIKKDGSQTAVSDFHEFSMLYAGDFTAFTGFSESEVKRLCRKSGMPFEKVRSWYDGYELSDGAPIYNPYSVMCAMREKNCRSFWGKSSSAEALTYYIKMDFDGLQETIANLIAGSEIPVNTDPFQNDFETFQSRDDVLTLLIHLGYLAYNASSRTVRIPNEEIQEQFTSFLSSEDVGEHWVRMLRRSNQLLADTIARNEAAVASALEQIRQEQYAPQYYNNEQALRAVIKYAYLSATGKYVQVSEMPSGKGIADVVFIPASFDRLPAMVVELKWNKTAGGAIAQIREKKYTAALAPFAGNILLVGINYHERTGKHTCIIEKA